VEILDICIAVPDVTMSFLVNSGVFRLKIVKIFRIILSMKKENKVSTVKLPTFLKGFASAFDITGQTLLDIPDFSTGFQRDTEALRGDWQRVGNDLRKAMDSFIRE